MVGNKHDRCDRWPVIKIAIVDDDQYFVTGMLAVLTAWFSMLGLRVSTVNASQADLVFIYTPPGCVGCFSAYTLAGFSRRALYFSLRETNGYGQYADNVRCPVEAGVIHRDMNITSALNLVIAAMGRRTLPLPPQCSREKMCVSPSSMLTLRQQDVAVRIKCGMALGEIARELNLSAKTVGGHKTAIMRKMGFKRNYELYQWLKNSPGF